MASKIVKHYNIHDILTFQIVYDDKKGYLPDLDFPFSYFEVDSVMSPDIILNVGPFEPDNAGCDVVFKKYHIKEGYIYCREQEGLAGWQVELNGIEDNETVINFSWERKSPKYLAVPNCFPQITYLEPVIDYKMSNRGYCLLHASGVSLDNRATLFTGRGGASKRHLAACCLKKLKHGLLGDDKVIINDDGKVFSFPKNLGLLHCLLEYNYTKNFNSYYRKVKTALTMIHDGGLASNKIEINDSSTLDRLYLVYLSEKTQTYSFQEYDISDVVRSVINNNLSELYSNKHFIDCLNAYSYVFQDSNYGSYSERLARNLMNPAMDHVISSQIAINCNTTKEIDSHSFNKLVEDLM